MKSWWITKREGAVVLEARDVPRPLPADGKMLVRVRAASLNRGDMLARIKRHGAQTARMAGVDGAGEVVDAAGSAFREGERVMFRASACIAEYALVDPALASRVPERFSWEEAGATLAAFITGWESIIEFGRMQRGDWVLLAGATSGVGVAALQMAKYLGARVIGTSGSPKKLAALKALGMDVGILARGSAFVDAALAATDGKGAPVVVNLIGGTAFEGCQRAAADFGRIIIVGYVDAAMHADFDLETVHGKRLQISGISNTPLSPAQRAQAHAGFMRDIGPAFESGAIKPVIDRVFAFDDAPAAKAYMESDVHLGKVVLSLV